MHLLLEYINYIIESELEESKLTDLVKKYPDLKDRIMFYSDLPGKYLEWIAKRLETIESDEDFKEKIRIFDGLINKNIIKNKDINFYKTVKDLEDVINQNQDVTSKTSQKKELKSGAKLIYQDNQYVILEPTTMESSCYYGYGTKWCISARENNYFHQYASEGIRFIFVINKEKPVEHMYHKIAFASHPDKPADFEAFDQEDDQINAEYIPKILPSNILNVLHSTGFIDLSSFVDLENKINKLNQMSDEQINHEIEIMYRTNPNLLVTVINSIPTHKLDLFYPYSYNSSSSIMNAISDRIEKLPFDDIFNLIIKQANKQNTSKNPKDKFSYDQPDMFRQPISTMVQSVELSVEQFKKLLNSDKYGIPINYIRNFVGFYWIQTIFAKIILAKLDLNQKESKLVELIRSPLWKNDPLELTDSPISQDEAKEVFIEYYKNMNKQGRITPEDFNKLYSALSAGQISYPNSRDIDSVFLQ